MNDDDLVFPTRGRDRPAVFKLGDCWVSVCHHREHASHEPAGCVAVFSSDDWPDAWTACLTEAVRHWFLYHAEHEVVYSTSLGTPEE